ncbi:MAG: leucine-rich repeat domain-containing protein [Nanoarchaeota archaeon]|nr:leucine-rich repeat domain-containing protein [Nanoarchaeota archaeon]
MTVELKLFPYTCSSTNLAEDLLKVKNIKASPDPEAFNNFKAEVSNNIDVLNTKEGNRECIYHLCLVDNKHQDAHQIQRLVTKFGQSLFSNEQLGKKGFSQVIKYTNPKIFWVLQGKCEFMKRGDTIFLIVPLLPPPITGSLVVEIVAQFVFLTFLHCNEEVSQELQGKVEKAIDFQKAKLKLSSFEYPYFNGQIPLSDTMSLLTLGPIFLAHYSQAQEDHPCIELLKRVTHCLRISCECKNIYLIPKTEDDTPEDKVAQFVGLTIATSELTCLKGKSLADLFCWSHEDEKVRNAALKEPRAKGSNFPPLLSALFTTTQANYFTSLAKLDISKKPTLENSSAQAIIEDISKFIIANAKNQEAKTHASSSLHQVYSIQTPTLKPFLDWIRQLDLSGNNLKNEDFPGPEATRFLPNVETLDLSTNKFSLIPPAIEEFNLLKSLIIRGNSLTEIDSFIFRMKSLKSVDITENPIRKVSTQFREIVSSLPYLAIWE